MTWDEIDKAINDLASKIDNKPDLIVGVVRGGIVPARLLASKLDVQDMYCLTVKKTAEDNRIVTTQLLGDLQSKHILLVEDMLESGKSLLAAKQYLESLGAEVTTLAIYMQMQSLVTPDYYLDRIEKIPIFPWENLTS